MAWTELKPMKVKNGGIVKNIMVGVSANAKNSRFSHWLSFSFRFKELDAAFLAPGKFVSVEFGDGADAGRLKITPGGAFLLMKTGGTKGEISILRIRALAQQNPNAFSVTSLKYEMALGGMIVTLPPWATDYAAPAAAQQAAPVAAPIRLDNAPKLVAKLVGGKPFAISAPSHAELLGRQGRP